VVTVGGDCVLCVVVCCSVLRYTRGIYTCRPNKTLPYLSRNQLYKYQRLVLNKKTTTSFNVLRYLKTTDCGVRRIIADDPVGTILRDYIQVITGFSLKHRSNIRARLLF